MVNYCEYINYQIINFPNVRLIGNNLINHTFILKIHSMIPKLQNVQSYFFNFHPNNSDFSVAIIIVSMITLSSDLSEPRSNKNSNDEMC